MNEVKALNVAWRTFQSDMPGVLYTAAQYDGRRYMYATKAIFDAGWAAAIDWRETQETSNG